MLSELDKTFAQVQGSKCRLAGYQASLTTALAPKDTTAGMLEVNYAILLEDPEKQSSSFVYLWAQEVRQTPQRQPRTEILGWSLGIFLRPSLFFFLLSTSSYRIAISHT